MNKAQQAQLAHILSRALDDLDTGLPPYDMLDKLVSRIANLLFSHDMTFSHTWFLDQVFFGKEKQQ